MELPKWTVLYNIVNETQWIGTGWEFFDNRDDALARYEVLEAKNYVPTLRSFHEGCDLPHMGIGHQITRGDELRKRK